MQRVGTHVLCCAGATTEHSRLNAWRHHETGCSVMITTFSGFSEKPSIYQALRKSNSCSGTDAGGRQSPKGHRWVALRGFSCGSVQERVTCPHHRLSWAEKTRLGKRLMFRSSCGLSC